MKEFIEYIVTQVATSPDEVVVETKEDGTQMDVLITVAQSDMGLIIGKEGRTIQSIRNLAKAKAIKENIKVNVELNDPYREEESASEELESEEE